MSFSPILDQVANGRRMAARSITLSKLSAIPCEVWRREIVPASTTHPDRHEEVFQGITVLSDGDDHAFEYTDTPIGYAKILLEDFTGSVISNNGTMVDTDTESYIGQIEPYDPALERYQQVSSIPDWEIKTGDLFALLLNVNVILWLEVVSPLGQSLIPDYGTKYILNRKELPPVEPMKSEFDNRT